MRLGLILITLMLSSSLFALSEQTSAPDFSLKGASGKQIKLSDFKGRTVVLEWLNHGCPFVKKHYESGNMQALQEKYTKQGIVWLSVISSAPGKQGHVDEKTAAEEKKHHKSNATDILLDPEGTVGKSYEAKTTPYMVVINAQGKLAYQGAIDSISSTEIDDIKQAENYVNAALDSLLAQKEVKIAKTKSYGCSVKY